MGIETVTEGCEVEVVGFIDFVLFQKSSEGENSVGFYTKFDIFDNQ